jgi:hypothetical protein
MAFLDLLPSASQTSCMAHTYMVFEFPNEEKAQQARHKLEGWKQAFRLDKKLQVKFDRGDEAATESTEGAAEHETEHAEEHKKSAKSKPAAKDAKHSKSKKSDKSEKSEEEAADSGPVKLLVRLYFSNHEKITEQQWFDRIPADELFKVAHPHVIHEKDAAFEDTLKQFDTLE